LPQGYRHSSTIAHYALAQEVAQVTPEEGIRIYQYVDDILIGGPDTSVVGQTQTKIITRLEMGMPGNRRELQHASGLLVFWRKHI
ncbi:hypothetical protein FQV24_0000218, partial [Spheniscus mendiculus]